MSSLGFSKDFFWGAASIVGAYSMMRFVQLWHAPTAEELERKAKLPLKLTPGKDDEVIIWGFDPADASPGWSEGIPDGSHFVTYVEVYCRLIKQPYTKKQTLDVSENPRGKVPFASVFGVLVDDSKRIVKQLQGALPEKAAALDKHLTEEQMTQGFLLQEMLIGNLYWVMVSQKMTMPIGRETMIGMLKRNGLPAGIRYLVACLIWRKAVANTCGVGVSMLSRSEIIARGEEAVEHISLLLGKKKFLFGTKPSRFDAMLYSWLVILFYDDAHAPYDWVKELRSKNPNLVDYVERVRDLAFPELKK